MDEGRINDSIDALEKLVKLEPFDHQVLLSLSLAYRNAGRIEEADRLLERRNSVFSLMTRMTELNTKAIREPGNAAVREELSEVCERLGRTELAEMWRDTARALRR